MPVLPVLEPLCQQAPPGSNTTTRLSLSFEKFVNILNGVLLPHTVPGNSTFSHVPYASRGGFSISVESLLLLHAANATSAKPQLLMRPRYTMNSPHLLLPGGSPRVRGEQILGAAPQPRIEVAVEGVRDRGVELVGAGEARGRILGEREGEHAVDVFRQLGERARLLRHDVNGLVERRVEILAADDRTAGEPAIGDGRERVEVGAMIDLLAARLLGRHVRRRADDLALRQRARGVVERGDAEVEHLPRAVVAQEDVVRLEIAMHDAARPRLLERRTDLREHRHERDVCARPP